MPNYLSKDKSQNPNPKKPLVVIYGPPGVGKLTVAKTLNQLTKLPLFHNHLSSDLVRSVFKQIKIPKLINKIRLDFIDFATESGCGLIFTFVYAYGVDDEFMIQLSDIAQKNNSPIYFIQLLCDENVWKDRVISEDRQQYQKVTDFDALKLTMEKYDLISAYKKESKNHKTIDITRLEPEHTAGIIAAFILEEGKHHQALL